MKLKNSSKLKQIPKISLKTWLPLLRCSLENLQKHIEDIANTNPFLEIQAPLLSNSIANKNYFDDIYLEFAQKEESLYETLDKQIAPPLFPTPLSQNIAKQIIFYINQEGYFEGDVEIIAKECNTIPEDVEKIRQRFAYLEPSGIGAKDYKESFLFQLLDFDTDEELSSLLDAIILEFEKIDKFLQHPRIKDALDILAHLKHPPAIEYKEDSAQIIPEFFVTITENSLEIQINNQYYPDITISNISDYKFAQKKLQEAKDLINLLELRRYTLRNIVLTLIEYQREFFLGGELKPLTQDKIAKVLNISQSTISRAIEGKYIQINQKVFAFKEFFSSAIVGISTFEIKKLIQNRVKQESKLKPFADSQLQKYIEEKFHISITQRCVAKYRQAMDIPPYKERKFLYLVQNLK